MCVCVHVCLCCHRQCYKAKILQERDLQRRRESVCLSECEGKQKIERMMIMDVFGLYSWLRDKEHLNIIACELFS